MMRRLRPLLPDRPLLPRRGAARRSPARVHAARHRDELRRARGGARRSSRGCTPRSGSRSPASSVALPFPRLSYARGDAPLRLGQARPALRARDRRRQRGRARARSSASSARPSRRAAIVRGLCRARTSSVTRKDIDELQAFAKEWGGKGLAHLIVEPTASCARRSPKFLSEAEVAAIREATGAEPGSVDLPRGRLGGRSSPACSARCARTSPSAST